MVCIRAALAEVRQLGAQVTTFLNVQPRSLTNPEFTSRLGETVRSAGLDESDIILELTEQQTIVNPRAFAVDPAAPARARLPHRARRLRRGVVEPEPLP